MSATRAALVVFLIGVLGVWLIKPIGDACPDLGKLPAGSRSRSAPSFAPPFTRTCTYATAGGIEAQQRYVPVVDWIVLAVLAGVVGLGVTLLGGSGAPGAARRPADVEDPPGRLASPEPEPLPEPEVARAAQRELERQERARRRGR